MRYVPSALTHKLNTCKRHLLQMFYEWFTMKPEQTLQCGVLCSVLKQSKDYWQTLPAYNRVSCAAFFVI